MNAQLVITVDGSSLTWRLVEEIETPHEVTLSPGVRLSPSPKLEKLVADVARWAAKALERRGGPLPELAVAVEYFDAKDRNLALNLMEAAWPTLFYDELHDRFPKGDLGVFSRPVRQLSRNAAGGSNESQTSQGQSSRPVWLKLLLRDGHPDSALPLEEKQRRLRAVAGLSTRAFGHVPGFAGPPIVLSDVNSINELSSQVPAKSDWILHLDGHGNSQSFDLGGKDYLKADRLAAALKIVSPPILVVGVACNLAQSLRSEPSFAAVLACHGFPVVAFSDTHLSLELLQFSCLFYRHLLRGHTVAYSALLAAHNMLQSPGVVRPQVFARVYSQDSVTPFPVDRQAAVHGDQFGPNAECATFPLNWNGRWFDFLEADSVAGLEKLCRVPIEAPSSPAIFVSAALGGRPSAAETLAWALKGRNSPSFAFGLQLHVSALPHDPGGTTDPSIGCYEHYRRSLLPQIKALGALNWDVHSVPEESATWNALKTFLEDILRNKRVLVAVHGWPANEDVHLQRAWEPLVKAANQSEGWSKIVLICDEPASPPGWLLGLVSHLEARYRRLTPAAGAAVQTGATMPVATPDRGADEMAEVLLRPTGPATRADADTPANLASASLPSPSPSGAALGGTATKAPPIALAGHPIGHGYEPYPLDLVNEFEKLTQARHKPPEGEAPAAAALREDGIKTTGRALRGYPSPARGDVVLGIKISDWVGEGAFGVVWSGNDLDTLEKRAVKVIKADKLETERTLMYFRRGVRAMRLLQSKPKRPRSVVEICKSEPNELAFSMPFLPGGDLSKIKVSRWALEDKLEVFRTLAGAVQFAHENGVIHRDIKPANIVMDSGGNPVLTDFDIADVLSHKSMSAPPPGSLVYAAPEQLGGHIEEALKHRVDIYSLGRVLYYLLKGEDPKRDDLTPRLDELRSPPKGLRTPEGLTRIIRKCTMADPKERYSSIAELLGDLDRYKEEPDKVGQSLPRAEVRLVLLVAMALVVAIVSVILAMLVFGRGIFSASKPPGDPAADLALPPTQIPPLPKGSKEGNDSGVFSVNPRTQCCTVKILDPASLDNSIRIGEYASLSGAQSNFGIASDNGVCMAVNEINDNGGLRGHKIALYRIDDGMATEKDTLRAKLTNWIKTHKLLAMIGEVNSALSIIGAQAGEKEGVPMISPSSTHPEVTQGRSFAFRVCFTDQFQGEVMARFMTDSKPRGLGLTKAALMVDTRLKYSQGLAKYFRNFLENNNLGAVVAEEKYNESREFQNQLERIAAKKPEVLVIPGYYQDVVLIVKEAQRQTLSVKLLGGDGWESVAEGGSSSLGGAYYSSHWEPDDSRKEAKDFVAKYRQQCGGTTPDSLAALGYDAMMLLGKAIETAKPGRGLKSWRKKVRDEIAKTKDFKGVTGTITIGEDHNAKKAAVVLEIDGKMKRAKLAATYAPVTR